jgi:hypothetical protein
MSRTLAGVSATAFLATLSVTLMVPGASLVGALTAAARVAIVCGAGVLLLELTIALAIGPQGAARRTGLRGQAVPWLAVFGLALVLAVALRASPSRAATNLLGFTLTAAPLAAAVQYRAGSGHATTAVALLGGLALASTGVDRRALPVLHYAQPLSPYRWTVNWPREGWLLRHDVLTPHPPSPTGYQLVIQQDGDYRGSSKLLAAVNGHDLGQLARGDESTLVADIPPGLLDWQERASIELRLSPLDPAFRIVAQRWAGAASLDGAASSFFDGVAWRVGTYDAAAGQPRPGIYVLELRRRD